MLRPLAVLFALPLLAAAGAAPADNPPLANPAAPAPAASELKYRIITPLPAPGMVEVKDLTIVTGPPESAVAPPDARPAGPAFPMVVQHVDPSHFRMVTTPGKPGYYPLRVVTVPGGVMDPPQTVVPVDPSTYAPGSMAPLIFAPVAPQK